MTFLGDDPVRGLYIFMIQSKKKKKKIKQQKKQKQMYVMISNLTAVLMVLVF